VLFHSGKVEYTTSWSYYGDKNIASVNRERNLRVPTEFAAMHPIKRSEFESTRQTHDVLRVDLGSESSEFWQVVPVDVDERCVGVHVISVQHRRAIGEQSLRLGDNGEAFRRFFNSRNENVVVERVLPTEVDEE